MIKIRIRTCDLLFTLIKKIMNKPNYFGKLEIHFEYSKIVNVQMTESL